MGTRARINAVSITNYKSIRTGEIPLGDLTLLVGPNGAGKSNVIDALRFVGDLIVSPSTALASRGGFRSVIHRTERGESAESFSVGLEIALPQSEASFHVRVDSDETIHETGEIRTQAGRYAFRADLGAAQPSRTVIEQALDSGHPDRLDHFVDVYQWLASLRFYSPDVEAIRRPIPAGTGRYLEANCYNLADILYYIRQERPELLDRINAYLRAIVPGYESAQVAEKEGWRFISFVPVREGTETRLVPDAGEMSDGTLRALALLTAAFQGKRPQHRVAFAAFEQPETNLHPGAAAVVIEAFREASESLQILASTHSPDLLDSESLDDCTIMAVERRGGATAISEVQEPIRLAIRNRLYSRGELLRMNLLTPAATER